MKTCVAFLIVVVVVGLGQPVAEAKGFKCPQDDPGVSSERYKERFYVYAFDFLESCFKTAITHEEDVLWYNARSLDDFRAFFKLLCPKQGVVKNCLDEVTSNLTSCPSKKTSGSCMIVADVTKHLLTAGCDQDGERLAALLQGTVSSIRSSKEDIQGIKMCIYKTVGFLAAFLKADIDLTSQLYLSSKELPNLKSCINMYQDESYKIALGWFLDEITTNVKCFQPESGALVLCNSLDVSSVKVSNRCAVKTQSGTDLYDVMEVEVLDCYSQIIGLDVNVDEDSEYIELKSLKEHYQWMSDRYYGKDMCRLETDFYADTCLAQQEHAQFQLFSDAVNQTIQQVMRGEGETMANIMHAVFQMMQSTPENGHAVIVCLKAVKAARTPSSTTSKNMRLYHEMAAFKQCLSDKLRADNNLAKDVEDIFDNVRRTLKCIDPEDANTVLCETIHVH